MESQQESQTSLHTLTRLWRPLDSCAVARGVPVSTNGVYFKLDTCIQKGRDLTRASLCSLTTVYGFDG